MDYCLIFGALPAVEAYKNSKNTLQPDMIIAADKGLDTVKALGLTPDIIVGDFDSLGSVPEGKNVVRLPVRKDETDVGYAVRLAMERGCKRIAVYGAVGGLLDHTFANTAIALSVAEIGGRAWFFGDEFSFTVIRNDTQLLPGKESGRVSVFAVGGPAKGVTIRKLSYEVENIDLKPSDHIGVSNEFIGKSALISVKNGALLIMVQNI